MSDRRSPITQRESSSGLREGFQMNWTSGEMARVWASLKEKKSSELV